MEATKKKSSIAGLEVVVRRRLAPRIERAGDGTVTEHERAEELARGTLIDHAGIHTLYVELSWPGTGRATYRFDRQRRGGRHGQWKPAARRLFNTWGMVDLEVKMSAAKAAREAVDDAIAAAGGEPVPAAIEPAPAQS